MTQTTSTDQPLALIDLPRSNVELIVALLDAQFTRLVGPPDYEGQNLTDRYALARSRIYGQTAEQSLAALRALEALEACYYPLAELTVQLEDFPNRYFQFSPA